MATRTATAKVARLDQIGPPAYTPCNRKTAEMREQIGGLDSQCSAAAIDEHHHTKDDQIMANESQNSILKPPAANESLIEAVLLLHSLGKPAATIASRCRIDQATTLHGIKHKTLPARQMSLLWDADCEVQS